MTIEVRPRLPRARGSVSEAVIDALRTAPGPIRVPRLDGLDLLHDDDAQLRSRAATSSTTNRLSTSTTGGSGRQSSWR